ncbi:MAG: DUF1926 domain-containing protein [Deltaproteobacteria bacterium]|nr:DUF1926 domain-containing protein [Deltaproteobacteria bacterium]
MYYLPFAIHNHQPVGNFDYIFEKAVDDCYFPFLKIVSEFPSFRFSLHFSGPLFEWMEKNRPELISFLQDMVKSGQIELMAGGFYEPLLPFIPEGDAVGQIKYMMDYLEGHFGVSPKGIWLSERVWDPSLPKLLGKLGIRYTLVDDTHFLNAGLPPEEINGYYITEREGYPLSIFPISKRLRYLIPFHPPKETIDYFKRFFSKARGNTLTYGDDGEKFGIWPGTKKWVYDDGWIKSFLRTLEEKKEFIKVLPLGEYIEKFSPKGRIYLPPASYEEMMEWALMPEMSIRYKELVNALKEEGKLEFYQPFIRGGTWENFLLKYEEANLMQKKMVYISKKLAKKIGGYRSGSPHPALRELWRGQCNCAYWHGLFGGLYLNHLREAIYRHLISAENAIEAKRLEIIDIDCDSKPEYLFSFPSFNAYFKPHYGGSLFELDLKRSKVNPISVIKRRKEAYHEGIRQATLIKDKNKGVKSIHEQFKVKEHNLDQFLIYDPYMRYSFLDHIFDKDVRIEDFYRNQHAEYGNLTSGSYEVKDIREDRLCLQRKEDIDSLPLLIKKAFFLKEGPASIKANYDVSLPLPLLFSVEFNFNLMTKEDPKRYLLIGKRRFSPGKIAEVKEVEEVLVVDEVVGWQIRIGLDRPMTLWLFPIETVNLSEEGAERSYQGTSTVFITPIKGEKRISLTLVISQDKI